MARIGDVPLHLDDGTWRARASRRDGYMGNTRFCSLQIENADGRPLVTMYFPRAELERVQMLAALFNDIANPAHDVPAAGAATCYAPQPDAAPVPSVGAGDV